MMEEPSDPQAHERQPLLPNGSLHSAEHDAGGGGEAPAYSAFSKSQKWAITFLVSLAATFSPLSSFIYYPALGSIARDLGVSLHLVDLTITSYMVVSAVAPSIIGDMADRVGRRPIFLFMLSVYLVANIGLAAQRSFAALLLLRMLQSAGSSGTISSAYAVIADIASPAERGLYIGVFLCGPNLAPSFGPIIGGSLASTVGWRWIFGLLSILSGACLLVVVLSFPETNRLLVGDGSTPAHGLNRTVASLFSAKSRHKMDRPRPRGKTKLVFPNPGKSVRLFFYKDTAIPLYINGIFYTTYCCLQASLSSIVINLYDFSEFQAGLVYVPFGMGCLLASYLSGRLMNYDYALTARAKGSDPRNENSHDSKDFPIEEARMRSAPWIISLSVASTCAYGWALGARLHVAIPLVLQFVVGGAMTMIFNLCGTLLVDQHPERPATAQASNNLMRCSMAAAGLALVQPLIDAVGVGWCYTIFAAVTATGLPLVVVGMKNGMRWRQARQEIT